MDPPVFDLPIKRQPQLKSLGGNTFKFEPEPQPKIQSDKKQSHPPGNSNANYSGISRAEPVTLSFDSIKVPNFSKGPNISQITSSEFDTEGREREFAGEHESKLYSIHEIYKFKKEKMYPKLYNQAEETHRKSFRKVAEHYSISKEKVSPLTESYFCYSRKNYPLRAIPYKDELDRILKTFHLKRGNHLNLSKCVDRANEFNLYWPGYLKDIRQYLSSCSCTQVSKLWCK